MSLPRTPALDAVTRGQPTWIEASAGTGKTWTLERIVVDRVREGASLESILVVTFTDKATREMRARVRATLDGAQREERDPVIALRLRAALLSFDRATIATLHGFCRRTLKEHAFLSGRALEEAHEGGRALFGAVFRRWLARELDAPATFGETHYAGLLRACLGWLEVPELEELTLRLAGERSPLEPVFSEVALDDALRAFPEKSALEAMLPELMERAGSHPAPRARIGSVLRGLDAARAVETSRDARLEALFAWASAGGPSGGPSGRSEIAHTNAAWLATKLLGHPTLEGPARVLSRSLMTPLPAYATLALPALRAELAREKTRASIIDFDDLVSGMVEALEGQRGAALIHALRARYQHVVVDEFQDTDPLQWSILSTLFSDCGPDRTFVLIGDPKQAIYGFRGADVHTYRRAKERTLAVGTSARLDTSFRATPALLDALHQVLLPEEGEASFFTRPGTYDAPVRPGDPSRRAHVVGSGGPVALPPITVLAVEGEPPLRLRTARRALARSIAQEARRLLSSDTRVGNAEGERRLVASDIFVLTRSQAEGLEVAEALARLGVPHAFFKQDGLFQTAEARDFSDLLSALVSPEDLARRFRALSTPFFAVAPEDFAKLRELPFMHPMLERFRALAARAETADVAELLSSILRTTGITRRELYLFASERRLTNYLHLSEVLTHIAIEERCGARELAARLAALVEGGALLGEGQDVQRIESERAAVQLLTMHKSKGLEAEVVFVYGGMGTPRTGTFDRRMGTRDGQRVAWLLPPSLGTSDEALEEAIADEDREESERLLYVAMTRARSLLYLPFFLAENRAKKEGKAGLKGPYRVVQERLSVLYERGALGAPHFRYEGVELSQKRSLRTLRKEPMAAPATALLSAEPLALASEGYEALRDAGGRAVVTSYSRMKSERDRQARLFGRLDAEVEAIQRYHEVDDTQKGVAPTPEDPGGASFGVAVHRALELLPVEEAARAGSAAELLAVPKVARLYDACLKESDVDPRARPLLSDLVFAALRTPVGLGEHTLLDLTEPSRRAAEVPFFLPLPEAGHPALGETLARGARLQVERGYLRGVIDLLFEHRGLLYVVDWKTDRLPEYGATSLSAHVAEAYAIQVKLYALALMRMLGGAPYSSRFGGLLYVFVRGLSVPPNVKGDEHLVSGPLFARAGLHFERPSERELEAWDDELRKRDDPFGYPLGVRPRVRQERRGGT